MFGPGPIVVGPEVGCMCDGIHVELVVEAPGDCPVAEASRAAGTPVTDVARTAVVGADAVTEEFTLDRRVDVDGTERVARYDSRDVHRFTRTAGEGCVCERIERVAGPVSEIRARDGALHVAFRAADLAAVREVVDDLRAAFGGVSVRRLRRDADTVDTDPVVVDRARLTDRQREVLEAAHELGYFAYPKGANAAEVAAALDISPSTFSEHLSAAQEKLTEAVLET